MRRTFFFFIAGLFLASAALAEDFWVNKEYLQWSDEEVRKILTNSPWAKDITISAPLSAVGGRGQRGAAAATAGGTTDVESGGGGGGRRGGGRRGGGEADGGGGGSNEALVTLNISWRSALPMRKALVRSRLGGGAATVPPEAQQMLNNQEEDYVVVVSGVPVGMARTVQSPVLLDKTTIRAGKKTPVAAKAMNVQPHTQSVDLIYLFPKTQPIAADDKEVEIVLKLGPVEAKKKFNLKEMVYNGKLEL